MRPGNSRRRIRGEKSVKTRHRESLGGSAADHPRAFVVSASSLQVKRKELEEAFVSKLCISTVIPETAETESSKCRKSGDSEIQGAVQPGTSENAKELPSFTSSRKPGLPTIRESEKTLRVKYSKIRRALAKGTEIHQSDIPGYEKLENPRLRKN